MTAHERSGNIRIPRQRAAPGGAPGPFDYAGGGFDLVRGSVVAVPLGRRTVLGVVWGPGEGGVDPGKVKPVAGVYPTRPLPPALCDFVDWVADYTLSSRGGVLSLALRSTEALEEPPTRTLYRLNPDARPRSTPSAPARSRRPPTGSRASPANGPRSRASRRP